MAEEEVLIRVDGVTQSFNIKNGWFSKKTFNAVEDVNLSIQKGMVYGLVGESGCGKSTLASNILMLTPPTQGHVFYNGKELNPHDKKGLRAMRRDLQLIFQDPYACMDPRMRIKDILIEPMLTHHIYSSKEECYAQARKMLEVCGMSENAMERFPHEFSGGQRQRISIAGVLGMNPKLVIADESTAALDISVQAQILNLLKTLQKEFSLTMVFVSHDLNVIRHISDRIVVMYMGRIVEIGDKKEIYDHPMHPYTRTLLSAVPNPDPEHKSTRIHLEGDLPSHMNLPTGCTLHPRCPHCMEICKTEKPELRRLGKYRYVACHLCDEMPDPAAD